MPDFVEIDSAFSVPNMVDMRDDLRYHLHLSILVYSCRQTMRLPSIVALLLLIEGMSFLWF